MSGLSHDQSLEWAINHFNTMGLTENRLQYDKSVLLEGNETKKIKQAKLLKRSPLTKRMTRDFSYEIGNIPQTCLIGKRVLDLPLPMKSISANVYDDEVQALFSSEPSGLFLDLGSGLRDVFSPNVINVEIDALPTTDVIAWGEKLPFGNGVFDGAVCLAVLEHVKDPFAVAAELVRVVKPGGKIIVDWPFLQPVHGYPHHYFNATMDGAMEAFTRLSLVADISGTVPLHMHPIFSLTWILGVWKNSLSSQTAEKFGAQTIDDLLRFSPEEIANSSNWATELPTSSQQIISAGSRIYLTRK